MSFVRGLGMESQGPVAMIQTEDARLNLPAGGNESTNYLAPYLRRLELARSTPLKMTGFHPPLRLNPGKSYDTGYRRL